MKKIIAIILILGALAGGGYWRWKHRNPMDKAEAVPAVRIEAAERGPLSLTVSTTGRVVSNLDVDIKCKASGEIIRLPFDVSDVVKQGDLLMELDPIDELRNVKKAKVSLSSSKARLEKAKENLNIAERDLANSRKQADIALNTALAKEKDALSKEERVRQLLEKKLAGQEEYDTAHTSAIQASAEVEKARLQIEDLDTQEAALELKRQDVALAKSDVESDQINLSIADQREKDTKVYAPIDGVITERKVQTGQIISSGISNVGGGTTAMTISDLSRIFVIAAVDESDIGRVQEGQTVRITADAFPRKRFMGRVEQIAPKGVSTQNVVTFEVKIEAMGKDKELLKPEMTANVEIVIEESEDALQLPVEAVKRDKERTFVNVAEGENREERDVKTGLTDGINIEIVAGLKDGEKVEVNKGAVASEWRRGDRPPAMQMQRQFQRMRR